MILHDVFYLGTIGGRCKDGRQTSGSVWFGDGIAFADDLGDALQRGQPRPVLQSCTWMLIDPTPRFPLAKKPNVAFFGL